MANINVDKATNIPDTEVVICEEITACQAELQSLSDSYSEQVSALTSQLAAINMTSCCLDKEGQNYGFIQGIKLNIGLLNYTKTVLLANGMTNLVNQDNAVGAYLKQVSKSAAELKGNIDVANTAFCNMTHCIRGELSKLPNEERLTDVEEVLGIIKSLEGKKDILPEMANELFENSIITAGMQSFMNVLGLLPGMEDVKNSIVTFHQCIEQSMNDLTETILTTRDELDQLIKDFVTLLCELDQTVIQATGILDIINFVCSGECPDPDVIKHCCAQITKIYSSNHGDIK